MNINKRLNYNFRAGYRLNMSDVLQDLEDKYRTSLKATVDSFESYDELSNETFNDAAIMKGQIGLLVITGYIDEEEANAMIQVVDEIRLNILNNLEKEGANNGSEKENI